MVLAKVLSCTTASGNNTTQVQITNYLLLSVRWVMVHQKVGPRTLRMSLTIR
jgi:hypothetical protein